MPERSRSSRRCACTERGIAGLTRRQARGTAMTEAMLVCIVLLFFFVLSTSLLRIWATDMSARMEAQRSTTRRASTFIDLNADRPEPEYTGYIPDPVVVQPPATGSDAPLGDYQYLPNTMQRGWAENYVNFGTGYWLEGHLEVYRQNFIPRPTWTWEGFPYVHTQDTGETDAVQAWWLSVRDQTIDADVARALELHQ